MRVQLCEEAMGQKNKNIPDCRLRCVQPFCRGITIRGQKHKGISERARLVFVLMAKRYICGFEVMGLHVTSQRSHSQVQQVN